MIRRQQQSNIMKAFEFLLRLQRQLSPVSQDCPDIKAPLLSSRKPDQQFINQRPPAGLDACRWRFWMNALNKVRSYFELLDDQMKNVTQWV